FGNLSPGERKTVNIVVKGKKPFAIEKIESEKSSGTFEVQLPKVTKPVHVVPLTVIAPSDPGTLTDEFTVTIAGLADPVTFKAYGKIGSTTGTAGSGKPGDAATAQKGTP